MEDEESNLSDSDDHLRSHVIHQREFQRLAQVYLPPRQQVPRQQEQVLQQQVQALQQLEPVQVPRQQELALQLQRLLQLLLQLLF